MQEGRAERAGDVKLGAARQIAVVPTAGGSTTSLRP